AFAGWNGPGPRGYVDHQHQQPQQQQQGAGYAGHDGGRMAYGYGYPTNGRPPNGSYNPPYYGILAHPSAVGERHYPVPNVMGADYGDRLIPPMAPSMSGYRSPSLTGGDDRRAHFGERIGPGSRQRSHSSDAAHSRSYGARPLPIPSSEPRKRPPLPSIYNARQRNSPNGTPIPGTPIPQEPPSVAEAAKEGKGGEESGGAKVPAGEVGSVLDAKEMGSRTPENVKRYTDLLSPTPISPLHVQIQKRVEGAPDELIERNVREDSGLPRRTSIPRAMVHEGGVPPPCIPMANGEMQDGQGALVQPELVEYQTPQGLSVRMQVARPMRGARHGWSEPRQGGGRDYHLQGGGERRDYQGRQGQSRGFQSSARRGSEQGMGKGQQYHRQQQHYQHQERQQQPEQPRAPPSDTASSDTRSEQKSPQPHSSPAAEPQCPSVPPPTANTSISNEGTQTMTDLSTSSKSVSPTRCATPLDSLTTTNQNSSQSHHQQSSSTPAPLTIITRQSSTSQSPSSSPTATDPSPTSPTNSGASSTRGRNRRNSKGVMVWANHSQRLGSGGGGSAGPAASAGVKKPLLDGLFEVPVGRRDLLSPVGEGRKSQASRSRGREEEKGKAKGDGGVGGGEEKQQQQAKVVEEENEKGAEAGKEKEKVKGRSMSAGPSSSPSCEPVPKLAWQGMGMRRTRRSAEEIGKGAAGKVEGKEEVFVPNPPKLGVVEKPAAASVAPFTSATAPTHPPAPPSTTSSATSHSPTRAASTQQPARSAQPNKQTQPSKHSHPPSRSAPASRIPHREGGGGGSKGGGSNGGGGRGKGSRGGNKAR
ncbi:hypothetical protein HK097_002565, partial [Rhizophlyctis rosea]